MKKLMALAIVAVGLMATTLFTAGVQAQGQLSAESADAGEATLNWAPAAEAAFYRIVWIDMEAWATRPADQPWQDLLVYRVVSNDGSGAISLTGFEPGVEYGFAIAGLATRWSAGTLGWTDWQYATIASPTEPAS